MKPAITSSLAVAVAVLALAATALAGTVTATTTVTGAGSITLSHGATSSLSSTLDGSDQNVTYTVPLTLIDARGTGAGWNVTLTSTTFTTGVKSLATTASSITGITATCNGGGTCTAPTNAISYPLTVPAAATAPAAVKIFNAASATGLGRFTVTPTVSVTIPGNSFSGTYTSTLTVAAVSGP